MKVGMMPHASVHTRVGELSANRQAAQRHSLSREMADVRTFGPNPHSFRGGGRDRQVGKPTYDSEVLDVHSAHQFHQWYTDIESRRKVEADERFRCHLDALDQYIKMCDVLLESADRSQEAFISLKDNYMSIVGRRQALQDECSQLASEKKRLLQFVQVLNEKLEHFEELEIIVQSFPGGLSKVDKDGLIPMLKRLDDCCSFIDAHPQYTAYSTYSVKCLQLQKSRALRSQITCLCHSSHSREPRSPTPRRGKPALTTVARRVKG